jgi:hypothetical protein
VSSGRSAGYSGRPQHAKLGLKPGHRVALDHAPDGWALGDLPAELEIEIVAGSGPADLIISFFTEAAALSERLPALARRIHPSGAVWVAWPRRAAGHRSDITDNVIRDHALPLGIVDVKVAAVDDDWSGLRLVWRKENR